MNSSRRASHLLMIAVCGDPPQKADSSKARLGGVMGAAYARMLAQSCDSYEEIKNIPESQ